MAHAAIKLIILLLAMALIGAVWGFCLVPMLSGDILTKTLGMAISWQFLVAEIWLGILVGRGFAK